MKIKIRYKITRKEMEVHPSFSKRQVEKRIHNFLESYLGYNFISLDNFVS